MLSISTSSVPFSSESSSRTSLYVSSFTAPRRLSNFQAHSCSLAFYGSDPNLCKKFYGLKLWILESLKFSHPEGKFLQKNGLTNLKNQNKEQPTDHVEATLHHVRTPSVAPPNEVTAGIARTILQAERISSDNIHPGVSSVVFTHAESPLSPLKTIPSNLALGVKEGSGSSLSIAVIGATGELARGKIFPAFKTIENVGIFGYSRKDLTDNDLRSIISSTLTCRVDHQKNCEDKLEAFLCRTYYLNGGFDNREGMSKLNLLMQSVEGASEANRIFYLSVPQEALLDVASCLADNAQTQKGWNRIIIEKPFGFNALSSRRLTELLLSKFEEEQIYRIDHLLGRSLIENLTVLRFSNLVFEPLWSRTYIRNIQTLLSEDLGIQSGRHFAGYGIIRDIVHSHILQTVALLAMEPPISL